MAMHDQSGLTPNEAGLRRPAALFMLPIAIVAVVILLVRCTLDYQFPVPWPDETSFISPAFQLASTGSLFDPGMNPDRTVMWMPPGYMVLLAGAFRLFGYSFALVRWISAVCMLWALGLTAWLAWRLTDGARRVTAGCVVGAAFLSPYALVDANIGRMEAPFCAIILLALATGLAGKPYVMGALVAVATLVHPNAIYFVPAVMVEFLLRMLTRRLAWPKRGDWLAVGAALACLAAYALHIALNRQGFIDDMRLQFAVKAFYGADDSAHPLWIVWCAAALALAAFRRLSDSVLPALFGLAFVLMAHFGHEIWYDYGQPIGFALLAIAWLVRPAMEGSVARRTSEQTAVIVAVALTVVIGFRITPNMLQLRPHISMLVRDFVPPSDIGRVRRFIATLHPGDTVDFGWSGMENFFLADLARSGAHWTIIRHSVTQSLPFRPSTWRVMCDSIEVPIAVRQFDISFQRKGADTGCTILPGLGPAGH